MTDRELLEAAAKAAGLVIVGPVEKYIAQPNYEHIGGFIVRNDKGGDSAWNPLTDDGDALRLAVKLRIDLHTAPINGDAVIVTAKRRMRSDVLRQPNPTMAAEDFAPDPYAATRRAIVRAAAAIGQEPKPTGEQTP